MHLWSGRLKTLLAAALAAAMAILLLGGCGHRDSGDEAGVFVVRQNEKVLASFSLARLEGLPQVDIATPQSHGEQVQHGPTVRAVLEAAGATDVRSVRVEGRDPAQTLSAAELTDQVVVSVTKRSTVKMSGANLDRSRWVRDVSALIVNP